MLDHFKFKYYRHKLQVNYHELFALSSSLYSDHCPKKWKNRRNFNHSKISDVEIQALFFYKFAVNFGITLNVSCPKKLKSKDLGLIEESNNYYH